MECEKVAWGYCQCKSKHRKGNTEQNDQFGNLHTFKQPQLASDTAARPRVDYRYHARLTKNVSAWQQQTVQSKFNQKCRIQSCREEMHRQVSATAPRHKAVYYAYVHTANSKSQRPTIDEQHF